MLKKKHQSLDKYLLSYVISKNTYVTVIIPSLNFQTYF